MKKIIKRGTKTPPDKKVYVIKCRTCGCVFTYKLDDMRYITMDVLGVFNSDFQIEFFPIENLREILTHEQMEQKAYKVGE